MIKIAAIFSLVFISLLARAGDIDPSGYSLYSGGEFYVLTDGVFTTDEAIKVRFEAGGNTSLQAYGGVDVRLYRVPKPLDFLRAQKNLHRPSVSGHYEGEGLPNVLSYLWDSWFKKARLAWQRVFSVEARKNAVATAPELKQTPAYTYATKFSNETQFKPIAGMDLVDTFRYPIWQAKTYQPPKDTLMEGSSSNFITTPAGNVILPMGKRKPGLYLVEAMIGSYRATTFVFVSDTVVVTKVSSKQALVWTTNRQTGISRPKSKVVLTDGIGVLDQGTADDDGVYVTKREIPERTFAMVEDETGGVAISENFFYESEVYQPKIFVFTDRPLYQPGDTVAVRAFGRDLKNDGVREIWSALTGSATATLTVVDAAGVPLITQKMAWHGADGAESQFKLPDAIESGGLSLKVNYQNEDYGASFRVARYLKPHFDAQILFDKPSYKVGEAIRGRATLTYPSGQPVVGAEVDLQVRAEQMTVYEGSYGYQGDAPVELKKKTYRSNDKGEITFSFPPAKKPSRYIVSVRAFDQAAYRVTTKKEILVEGFLDSYILTSDFNATEPNQPVKIHFDRQGLNSGDMTDKLKTWQAIRLEDRSVLWGSVSPAERGDFTMKLEKPGHYVVRVVDSGGVTRGVRSHVVLGPGLKSATGQIEILADREEYSIGDTAKLIVTFTAPADDALLTIERNEVSSYGRLMKAAGWFKAKRLGEAQWEVEVPILDSYSPNVIFSVASAKSGEFGFQNKGLVVKKPTIDIVFKPNKSIYAPGEKVIVDIDTKLSGKPLASLVAVSAVNEMIYVLQPEIAPPIGEFFHHIRRDQVRTSSSLSFYSFNPATSETGTSGAAVAHRDLKLQERARRDNKDTAYWNGSLKTDDKGHARFEFVMPDAITRWRFTGRALSLNASLGAVGESKSYVISNQDFYLKWTGPTRFRQGDKPHPAVIAFNSTNKSVDGQIIMTGTGYSFSQKIPMKPGLNTLVLEDTPTSAQELDSTLSVGGKTVDHLTTKIEFAPPTWEDSHSKIVRADGVSKLDLPADAKQIRVKFMPDIANQFQRIADDLLEYPWGCVEQTSSRLIPFVMAAKALTAENPTDPFIQSLTDQIAADRRRLVSMAGRGAAFTWWGNMTEGSLMLTAHAYHADFRASKFLGIQIAKEAWENLLEIYAKDKSAVPIEKAYTLWVLSYIGQPVKEQTLALANELVKQIAPVAPAPKTLRPEDSEIIDSPDSYDNRFEWLIVGLVAQKNGVQLPPAAKQQIDMYAKMTWDEPAGEAAALDYLVHNKTEGDVTAKAEAILSRVRYETPTIDRALALAFIEEAFPQAPNLKAQAQEQALGSDWQLESRNVATYRWKAKLPPQLLPKMNGGVAEVIYQTAEKPQSTLDYAVSRKLYRVVFGNDSEKASSDDSDDEGLSLQVAEMKPNEALDPRALYVDEITLDPKGAVGKFLLIDVPLPPGGDVDGSTWGIKLKGLKTNFVEARSSEQGLGYSIPVESLGGAVTYHQLVRFSARGHFQLPPVKVFKMYRTLDRAFEANAQGNVIDIQ